MRRKHVSLQAVNDAAANPQSESMPIIGMGAEYPQLMEVAERLNENVAQLHRSICLFMGQAWKKGAPSPSIPAMCTSLCQLSYSSLSFLRDHRSQAMGSDFWVHVLAKILQHITPHQWCNTLSMPLHDIGGIPVCRNAHSSPLATQTRPHAEPNWSYVHAGADANAGRHLHGAGVPLGTRHAGPGQYSCRGGQCIARQADL